MATPYFHFGFTRKNTSVKVLKHRPNFTTFQSSLLARVILRDVRTLASISFLQTFGQRGWGGVTWACATKGQQRLQNEAGWILRISCWNIRNHRR